MPLEYPININTADEQVLQALTCIGPTYAARIVEYRLETGGFTDIEQLENIHGIGPATMEKIRPFISVE